MVTISDQNINPEYLSIFDNSVCIVLNGNYLRECGGSSPSDYNPSPTYSTPTYADGFYLCYDTNNNCCSERVKLLSTSSSVVDTFFTSCASLVEIVISDGFVETAAGAFAGDHHYLLLSRSSLLTITTTRLHKS